MESCETLYRLLDIKSDTFLSIEGITYFQNESTIEYFIKIYNLKDRVKIIEYKLIKVKEVDA